MRRYGLPLYRRGSLLEYLECVVGSASSRFPYASKYYSVSITYRWRPGQAFLGVLSSRSKYASVPLFGVSTAPHPPFPIPHHHHPDESPQGRGGLVPHGVKRVLLQEPGDAGGVEALLDAELRGADRTRSGHAVPRTLFPLQVVRCACLDTV